MGMLDTVGDRNRGHFSRRGRPFPVHDHGEIQRKMAQEICSRRRPRYLAPLLNFFLYFRREKCDKFLRIQKTINSLHYFCRVRKGGEYVKFGKRNL